MGDAGSTATMKASLEADDRDNERRIYFEKRSYFKKDSLEYKTSEENKLYNKELSKKERYQIRLFSQNQRKKENLLNAVILTMSIFMTLGIMVLSLFILSNYYSKS